MRNIILAVTSFAAILAFFLSFVLGPPFTTLAISFGVLYVLGNIFLDKKYFWTPALFGAVCNLLAVTTNGGQMPVANPLFGLDAAHKTLTASTHLKFLCDIFPLGTWGVISIGDMFICGGTLLTVLGVLVYRYIKERKVAPSSN